MEANHDSANVSSNPSNDIKESTEKIFVNHAEIAWQEMRKKWVGDPSKRTSEMPMEPVIGFNATYEDLLLPNTPFPKPIPLAEMVDFLVDYWHGDGLFE
uniref:Gag1-like clamp domain-containing protein n=1 Tax=Noccaea caerulescens TaxID=107243 RepID=A0A1J3I7E5_NOCCA